MKIAFVTGSLQPGRDGVGDYTRTLAEECARRGHQVRLLAVAEAAGGEPQETPQELRLDRATWRGPTGAARARAWLERFAPDWVSLQFVPYSFDPRGLFAPSIPALADLAAAGRRTHVFFHETWIGSQHGASLKTRVVGAWQRRAVRRLLHRLRPALVHTSTPYYVAALGAIEQPATVLPMFGSVPPGGRPGGSPRALAAWPATALVCGHFGTLHPDWAASPFLDDFAALAAERRQPAVLAAVGSLGYGAARFAELQRAWQGRVALVALGRCPVEDLPPVFARFSFAVTSVPWNLIGKSSSAAALREHGLSVVVTNGGQAPRFAAALPESVVPGMIPYFRARSALRQMPGRTTPFGGVAEVARRFLDELGANP